MTDQAKEAQEITQLLHDFRYVKNAVMKNWVFKFLSPRTLRPVYLSAGLLVIACAVMMHLLCGHYGSYDKIPGAIKTIYFGALALAWVWLGYTKLHLFLKNVREFSSDITVFQFFKAVYTWSTMVVVIPFLAAMGLAIIFLISHGLSGYLVPCLAILYGFMLNSVISIVYWRELVVGAVWHLLSGFGILFTLGPSQPLLGLTITFGLGFLAMYIASWIYAADDRI